MYTGNNIGAEGANALVEKMKCPKLTEISLHGESNIDPNIDPLGSNIILFRRGVVCNWSKLIAHK